MNDSKLDMFLKDCVEERFFPGATYAVGTSEQVRFGAIGQLGYGDEWPDVTVETPYDLASLTKVVCTSAVARSLVERTELRLETRVSEILKDFPWESVTVEHLLTHESGLPAYLPWIDPCESKGEILERIMEQRLVSEPGTDCLYSCLGFVVLQGVLERFSGTSLDTLFKSIVQNRFQWIDTTFRGTSSDDSGFPPTTLEVVLDGSTKFPKLETRQGRVHDPISFALGGVSGNAGLFGTAKDLAQFCQSELIDPNEWQQRFAGRERGLGWDVKGPGPSSAGELASSASFGHTGFTGTSLWIDPEVGVFGVLLTNAVYPEGQSRNAREFRGTFMDLALRHSRTSRI